MAANVTQRQQALAARFTPWSAVTLHDVLDRAEREYPERPFVVTDDTTLSYADVAAWSRRLATGLAAHGVAAGDRVALLMANYPEFIAIKYAISRIGAVAVPINIFNRQAELSYLLGQSGARLLVTMDRFRDLDYLAMLDALAPGWASDDGGSHFPCLKHVIVFQAEGAGAPAGGMDFACLDDDAGATTTFAPVDPSVLCDIIYTSGTTGDPKGVELTHDMLTRTAFGSAYARAFEDGHRIIFSLPMFHVFGYVEALLAVPYVGGAIVPQLKFDAVATLDAIERHQPTDALLIPAMTLAVLDVARSRAGKRYAMRCALASGGRAPQRIWQDIYDVLGVEEITTGYGMTETTASTTVTRPDDPLARIMTTNGRMRDVGPAGAGHPGNRLVQYRVVDPATGIDLPFGVLGELEAKGPGVTRGYFNKPRETAAAFTPDGWLRTGDLGLIDSEGYIKLVGRTKESYRCGGEQVLPSEIESLLTSHPDVLQAHVVPMPDERMGEIGVAFIVPRSSKTPDIAALGQLARDNLARFKVPRHFIVIAEGDVPVTPSGRPRKFLLTQLAIKELGST